MNKIEQEHLIDLSKKIKKFRTTQQLTQEELAYLCGFDRTYISLLECGKRNPSFLNLIKLCNGLKISIQELLGEKNEL